MHTNHNFCKVNRLNGPRAKRRRDMLKEKQNNLCHWCSCVMTDVWKPGCGLQKKTSITVDHVVPLVDGGSNHERNTVAACYFCNNERNREDTRKLNERQARRDARLRVMEHELNGGICG